MTSDKPNILIILIDDMVDDMGRRNDHSQRLEKK